MTRLALVIAMLASLLLALPTAQAAPRCKLAGSKQVYKEGRATVVTRKGHTFACHRDKGVFYRLEQRGTDFGSTIQSKRFATAGKFLAYVETFDTAAAGETAVEVRDLITGKVRTEEDASMSPEVASVTALAVASSGAVAWIAIDGFMNDAIEVFAARLGGKSKLLATGAAIAKGSIAIRGASVAWSENGAEKSAPLP